MKKMTMYVASIFGLMPAITFAAQERVNCDDLAHHIQEELSEMPGKAIRNRSIWPSKNTLMVLGDDWKYNSAGTHIIGKEPRLINCDRSPDRLHLSAYDLQIVSDTSKKLLQYRNSLKHCLKNSSFRSPVATKTMDALQQQIDLNSQCTALHEQSFDNAIKRQKAAMAKREKEQKQKEAMEDYINATNSSL